MKLINVMTELWCGVWLIAPESHRQLCRIVEEHLTGAAHLSGGIHEQAGFLFPMPPTEEQDAGPKMAGNVCIIDISGALTLRATGMEKMSGLVSVAEIREQIDAALDDDRCEGILLSIESPGGQVKGIPELAEYIVEAKQRKPIAAFCDSQMCSAAYWLAAGVDAIYVTPSCSVGNVGAYLAWTDKSRAMEMAGLKAEIVKTDKFKGAGAGGLSITADQRAQLQARVDELGEWFKSFVIEHRGVAKDDLQGQTFFGRDAVQNGIADALGDEDDAVAELVDLIKDRKAGL